MAYSGYSGSGGRHPEAAKSSRRQAGLADLLAARRTQNVILKANPLGHGVATKWRVEKPGRRDPRRAVHLFVDNRREPLSNAAIQPVGENRIRASK